jgi:hypothetical protein
MLGSLVGHVIKHVICKILYYRFAEDAGVGSSLMAPKNKGEGEGRVTYQDTCGADNVQKVADYFHAFGGPKAPQWGGLIQVAPDTCRSPRGLRNGQNSKWSDSLKLAPDRSARRPDSNGVNDTQIRARMEEIEPVKVQG